LGLHQIPDGILYAWNYCFKFYVTVVVTLERNIFVIGLAQTITGI